jgi:hypothetical protein
MADQRTFKAPNINLKDFAQQVANFHQNEGYEVQVVEAEGGIMVQSRAKDFIKRYGVALTVTATVQGENVLVQTGHAKWGMNAASGVAAALVFWPLLAIPAYTSIKQKQLIDDTWELVERYMVSIGAAPTMAVGMPPLPVAATAPAPASQPAERTCPSCGKPVRADAKFCDNCGKPLAAVCAKCGAEVRQGAKFCDNCGAAVG